MSNNNRQLYNPTQTDNKMKNNNRQLYNSTQTNNNTNSIEQTKTNILLYKDKIENTRSEILKTTKTTIEVLNKAGNDLNEQTDSLNKINTGLDKMEKKLNHSSNLVKTLSSWFTLFKSVPTMEPIDLNQSVSEIKTKFKESDTSLIKHNIHNSNISEKNIYDTEYEKIKEIEFYEQLFKGIDMLEKNSQSVNKILIEHNAQTEIIDTKIDKNNLKIQKNTHRLGKI